MDEDSENTTMIQDGSVDLAIIGCGTLGSDILFNILRESPSPFRFISVTVGTDASATRLRQNVELFLQKQQQQQSAPSVTVTTDNLDAISNSELILLACKPYQVAHVLGGNDAMRDALRGKCIISVIAGWSSKRLFELLFGAGSGGDISWRPDGESSMTTTANACKIIRAIPNVAAATASSMTVIESLPSSTPWAVPSPSRYLDLIQHIFTLSGSILLLPETQFEAGAGLAGMGAAFLSVAVDGLLDGAVYEGVKRAEGKKLVVGVLRGLAALMDEGREEEMGSIRERTASPAGTTIRGLVALERAGVRVGFADAVIRAVERGKEIENAGK